MWFPKDILKLLFLELYKNKKRKEPSQRSWKCVHLVCRQWYIAAKQIFNPAFGKNVSLREAAVRGETQIVRELLQDPRVDPTDVSFQALRDSCTKGNLEIINLLLEDGRSDPWAGHPQNSFSISYKKKQLDVLCLLLNYDILNDKQTFSQTKKTGTPYNDVHDPMRDFYINHLLRVKPYLDCALYQNILWHAIKKRKHNILSIILYNPHQDPSFMDNVCLELAEYMKDRYSLRLLIQDERVLSRLSKKEIVRFCLSHFS